jgi:DNA replication protein DnaC
MNTQVTLQQLQKLNLQGMARSYEVILELPMHQHPPAHQLLAQLVQHEFDHKHDQRTQTYLRLSKLRYAFSLEQISCSPERNLSTDQLAQLAGCTWIDKAENVLITGATGCGKSYLACAIGHQACMMGYKTLYFNMNRFIEQLGLVRLDGTWLKLLNRIEKVPVLILDDFGLQPLNADVRMAFLQILEDRYARKSTIIASQLPVGNWYEYLKDETLADAILDRLTARASRIELKGKSLRTKD